MSQKRLAATVAAAGSLKRPSRHAAVSCGGPGTGVFMATTVLPKAPLCCFLTSPWWSQPSPCGYNACFCTLGSVGVTME